TRRPLHFDFLAIDMNKEVTVMVEIKFEGRAEGTREGGALQPLMRQLEVECLPEKIPEFITIDVTPLHNGQSIHLSEITLPEGVKATATEDLAIVTCNVIKEEEVAPAAPAADVAPAEGAAAPAAPAADAKKDDKK